MRSLLVSLVVLALAPGVATAAGPPPDEDPFFAVPKRLAKVANGAVLASRPVEAVAGPLPMPATSWQVKYRSQDTQGRPTATVTTLMVPDAPWPGPGPRPLLSYQTAEDGIGARCAPSYALTAGLDAGGTNSNAETLIVRLALERGWTVAVPDYEGPHSEFLGAQGSGRMVLDGIRAARRFKPAAVDPEAPIGMWGYSGGSLATAIAAQLQRRHAPHLRLAGIALGGTVADIKATIRAFDGSAVGGAIIMGLAGVDRAYPRYRLKQYLNDFGREAYEAVQKDCINDAAQRYPGLKFADIESVPNALELPQLQPLFRRISPLHVRGVPSAPVYEYHAVGDELAPVAPARELVRRYCDAGVPVLMEEKLAGEHISEAAAGAPGALDYLGARFAGEPPRSSC